MIFPELIDWTTHSDANIRYYSGTARYHKTFELSFPKADSASYFLQLEDVRDVGIARIRINGVDREREIKISDLRKTSADIFW